MNEREMALIMLGALQAIVSVLPEQNREGVSEIITMAYENEALFPPRITWGTPTGEERAAFGSAGEDGS